MKTSLLNIPSSVYRLQLNAAFPLKKAIALLPYLEALGIDGIYCSPIFECASSHGYDVTNPNRLNPDLGTMEEYEEFCSQLKKRGLKQVLDIVPNHMGIKEGKNEWWLSVCQYGPDSPYGEFFDINWKPEKKELENKILLPILNNHYHYILEDQKLTLIWKDGFWICFYNYRLPITPHTYYLILECLVDTLSAPTESNEREWAECLAIYHELKRIEVEEKNKITKFELQKQCLIALYNRSEYVRFRFDQVITLLNGEKGDAKSFDLLHELLERQFYRLSYWGVAGQEINYRRFFNVNELVAIHIENEKVLNTHHNWIFELIQDQKVQGLRIDHPDGLYDPAQYFERIQAKEPSFVVVEKILNFKEALPENWNVEGSVGYEFLNLLNGLFIQNQSEEKFDQIYENFIGNEIDFTDLLYKRKRSFIIWHMASEVNFLGSLLYKLAEKSRYYRDFTRIDLTQAVLHVMACFPVYRTYITSKDAVSKKDKACVTQAIEMAKTKAPEIDPSVFQYLKSLLLFEYEHLGPEEISCATDFVLRFQQLTGPVMAKGLEDSVCYIYNRLISLNEVGGNLECFGYSKSEFHQFNKEKLAKWPFGFLASSTHDTKFSKDVRMRINVLSEMPQKWQEHVSLWKSLNKKYKKPSKEGLAPDNNTEYYIYQMLIGIWPLSKEEYTSLDFKERIWQCLLKIIREAGLHTSWRLPNDDYEKATKEFLYSLITPAPENEFFDSFLQFQQEVAHYGSWNSLCSLVLKIGSCGIVDIYQGNEHWSYCLVDPDNRRSIDYEKLSAILKSIPQFEDLEAQTQFASLAFSQSNYQKLKLYVTSCGLNYRRAHKELFLEGEYIPLRVHENMGGNVVAFMRKHAQQIAIVVTGCYFSQLVSHDRELPLGESCWATADLALPDDLEVREFVDIFTGKTLKVQMRNKVPILLLSEIFEYLPFAILTHVEKSSYVES